MFIDRGVRKLRIRSEERKVAGIVKPYLNSASPNGVVCVLKLVPIDISLPTE
jgi:hypothetical protein